MGDPSAGLAPTCLHCIVPVYTMKLDDSNSLGICWLAIIRTRHRSVQNKYAVAFHISSPALQGPHKVIQVCSSGLFTLPPLHSKTQRSCSLRPQYKQPCVYVMHYISSKRPPKTHGSRI